jgi:hypothetical protein
MKIKTGQTVYEQILSLDLDNNPVTGVTFDVAIFKNGIEFSGVSVNISLSDPTRAIYLAEWSASTEGSYQLYAKNNTTDVIFVSDTVLVAPDSEFSPDIYIGL